MSAPNRLLLSMKEHKWSKYWVQFTDVKIKSFIICWLEAFLSAVLNAFQTTLGTRDLWAWPWHLCLQQDRKWVVKWIILILWGQEKPPWQVSTALVKGDDQEEQGHHEEFGGADSGFQEQFCVCGWRDSRRKDPMGSDTPSLHGNSPLVLEEQGKLQFQPLEHLNSLPCQKFKLLLKSKPILWTLLLPVASLTQQSLFYGLCISGVHRTFWRVSVHKQTLALCKTKLERKDTKAQD